MNKLLIIVISSFLCLNTSIGYATNTDWELKKDKKDVQVFTRDKADSLLKEFKGTITLKSTPLALKSILQDVDSYLEWMPDITSAKLIRQDTQHQLHYIHSDLPWPVSDRDGIYQFDYANLANGAIKLTISAQPQALDTVKGSIRIPYVSGCWRFEAVDKNMTKVTYQLHADPGGSLPKWLINSSVVDAPYQTLLNLKAYAEK